MFDAYQEVSEQASEWRHACQGAAYHTRVLKLSCHVCFAVRILSSYSACVQPLSCDEAYIDITGLGAFGQEADIKKGPIVQAGQVGVSCWQGRHFPGVK